MMRDHLILYVNGRRHAINGSQAFRSLADFLRMDLGLVGTKVVCSEGDCGSCSILIGRPDVQDGNRLRYETVCSCILFIYQLDCAHIVTVEGLKYDRQLNPVQEAMVTCHGSQCGFCTPGFVMSLCSMFENQPRQHSAADVRSACVGNLCRCTGYESTIRAGCSVDPSTIRPLNELYPPAGMLADFVAHATEAVQISADGRTFLKSATIAQAAQFRRDHSDCTIVAGGTDIGVQVNKGTRDPRVILSLSGLEELRAVQQTDGIIIAGALATIADVERATCNAIPEFAQMLYWFGSPPIRNAGTIGGNIANGSPIGDTMPALFVLNGQIELTGTGGSRRININEFYTGYRQTAADADELITRVFIPIPATGEIFKLYKVSRRKDLDISAFTAAIWMRRAGETIADVRIAYGGVGPTILRLHRTEAFFRGNVLTSATVRDAGRIARSEIAPISDVRGSAEFRAQLGQNILRKFYAEFSAANGNNAKGNGRHETVSPS